ncbi:hypothetical protein L3073_10890 [Ancylomarina sp. DW003]|nr:hypothetical protein [Ancylomarina sp. DW003]MDE5422713.1 hypothetical protein [Ancylomarina sp. DW003]
MKILNKIVAFIFILSLVSACETDEDKQYSLDYISAPANVSVVVNITQDNTGLVSITPNADGALSFKVDFGDDSEMVESKQGETLTHIYGEGVYNINIIAVGATGETAEITQELNVSFKAPENLEIVVENDAVVSQQVNLTATADYATVFDIYFGETPDEEPTSALPGDVATHIYANAGDYEIRVVAKGAAIATVDSTFTFTVTSISAPVTAAPTPPARIASDVISIFSDAYADVEGTDFNPNWGQSTVVSTEDVAGNATLKYATLNYQGTQFGSTQDASSMEFLHIDMWTVDATSVQVFPISETTGENSYDLTVTEGEWVSYDIPLTYFTDLGLSMADVFQFKFVGTDGSTIYLDNIYFYKAGSTSTGGLTIPLNFESTTLNYEFTDFDGGAVTVIDNPQSSGINTSTKVAQMLKSAGQTWGGSFITLDSPIDFSAGKTFSMKVYSPRIGAKVLLKVENIDDGGISFEKEVSTTVANAWEELTFDYTGINTSNSYQKVVLIFDNGTMGDGSADFTFLFDDIQLVDNSGGLTQIDFPVDFESATVDYSLTDFGGNSTVLGTDPADAGNKVAITTKESGAETWAGTTIGTELGFASNVPLSASSSVMTVRVYSPAIGLQIRLKGEDHTDPTLTVETEATTTVANGWEVLSFDFSDVATGTNPFNPATNFDKFSIFFDFGNNGDDATYYWDEVKFIN